MDTHAAHSLPEELLVLPLQDFVVFPSMSLPVFVARERSIQTVEAAVAETGMLLLVAQKNSEVLTPRADDLHAVGSIVRVMSSERLADGRLEIAVEGVMAARIEDVVSETPVLRAQFEVLPDEEPAGWSPEVEAMIRSVRLRVDALVPLMELSPEVSSITKQVDEPGRLADLVASHMRFPSPDAQRVLEVRDAVCRLRQVDGLLRRELEVRSVQAEIQNQAQEELSRGQRESILREQLRAIQRELGEGDARGGETEEYRTKLEDADLPSEAREEAQRQLSRLERMHPDGPEAQVVRNYLDWVVELPWNHASTDLLDLGDARQVLDDEHAHLVAVKDRVLEFLGVRKLRGDSRGPILCFVGPPGVGKTSLGRSIAHAMGREFARISLGGVSDEAEIRGHRRTYIGAMPGRIIQSLKQAGTNNPVFMLDELDKLGSDYRGDPSAALLEVLDPEQNASFSDHFLNVPFDLSQTLFIATANSLDPIPAPLRDRMEIVSLSGYTPEEKVDIANRFLLPRQTREHGLDGVPLKWSRGAVERVVAEYTCEAGVRNLERQVAAVCRKVARRVAEGNSSAVSINRRTLSRYLGPPPFEREAYADESAVGVARGLAWTEAGGVVLSLEATLSSGRGLVLTGQLGDVMKESGQAALSFARCALREMEFPERILGRHEVHVHVPAGATPKDGPSAGVAMATILVSLATGIPVRGDVAMTGEITLRGRVLPVGGVREKALAALRHGISRVIIPRQNLKDVTEIPRELKRKITFIPVTNMSEVLDAALERNLSLETSPMLRTQPSTSAIPASARKR